MTGARMSALRVLNACRQSGANRLLRQDFDNRMLKRSGNIGSGDVFAVLFLNLKLMNCGSF